MRKLLESSLKTLRRLSGKKPLSEVTIVGNPVLRKKTTTVDINMIGSDEFRQVVDMMVATMRDKEGVGLAAPQVDLPLKMFAMEFTEDHYSSEAFGRDAEKLGLSLLPLRVVVNPVMRVGRETCTHREGCLSVPGLCAHVTRHKVVELEGIDATTGKQFKQVFHGWPARIVQHEMDHLEGVLYTDKMLAPTLANADEMFKYPPTDEDVIWDGARDLSDLMRQMDK